MTYYKIVNGVKTEMTAEEIEELHQQETEYEYQNMVRPRTETEGILVLAQSILNEKVSQSDDKTLGIACMALFPYYVQNQNHEVGEVARDPETGYPYECMTAYDGTVQQDWTIENRTLWKPWHSRSAKYALPWVQPTGAHDMYHSGEYMIWTDKKVYKCILDTNFSPDEYPAAWEDA